MRSSAESICKNIVSVFALIVIAAFPFVLYSDCDAEAVVYNNKEKIYLKEITPILYELSEVGKSVSEKAVNLQNSSSDVCSYEFGYYQGIVEGLRVQLNSIPPPPRMVNVQSTALLAIGDYISGLSLYTRACTEPDYNMKAKMGYDGRQRLIDADLKIRQVNKLIMNPQVQTQAAAPDNRIEQMCASTWPADQRMQEYCVKNQTEALSKLNQMMRTYPAGSRERQTIQNCSSLWKKGNTYDYRMVMFCVENILGKQSAQ
ncbi:MAG: hypothetical protein L0213_11405 [Candidatus Dadabacteria bacterium]|nr:hypothetical protein [Candidatus Dadabacteria bacterium]